MDRQILRRLILTALFAAIIAVAAPISIPIGTVSHTLSVFAIFLCGAILPPVYAASATLVYIALGAVGLPVFSNFEGGIGKLVGYTGGFIWSYPLMALVIALSVMLFKKRSILSLALGMTAALIICYIMGTMWYSHLAGVSFEKGLIVCFYPFIGFDILKAVAAIALTLGLRNTALFNKNI